MIIGSNAALERARARFAPGLAIEAVEESGPWPSLCALQAGPEGEPIIPGKLSADGGRFAFQAVERGVRLALGAPFKTVPACLRSRSRFPASGRVAAPVPRSHCPSAWHSLPDLGIA